MYIHVIFGLKNTTLRFYLILVRLVIIRKQNTINVGEDKGKKEPYILLVKM
jgi:hypothetical protein